MKTAISQFVRQFLVLSAALGAVLLFAMVSYAWTGPPASPPNSNTDAPLNVGAQAQTKAGALTSSVSVTAPQFCIGASCISSWPASAPAVPNCRICVQAGDANGTYGPVSCTPFNGAPAASGAESGYSGRGSWTSVQVLCP